MILGLSVGVAALVTGYSMWRVYDIFFSDKEEEEVPSITYLHNSEIFQDPQMGIDYRIEDTQGVDADKTLEAINEWIQEDEPNLITGDYDIKVSTLSNIALVEISGDASSLLLDSYNDVEIPYVDGENNLEWVKVDMDFT